MRSRDAESAERSASRSHRAPLRRLRVAARGLSPHARRVLESGTVQCVEWSNYTLALRYTAAAMGVPFVPARSLLGTDTFAHSPAKLIECPFTGAKLAAIPALYPDVAA